MEWIVELAGWIGAFGLLLCFYMNASGKWSSQSPAYIYLNLFAAALLTFNSWATGSWHFVMINVFWMLVSLQAIWKRSRKTSV
ncbi:MAG: hypothetical protein GYB31_08035 [Bacteroidetes bacterium]|nr:hypothetical protein [Bacteroidota bacterium]